ncbi:MAG TPA: IS1380 family transposase, partial [Isosphaeraceae bacterium]|nr:IS1380 family transposase [Isosphaeraceae bacterium]
MTRERERRILRERKRRILDRLLNRPGPERDHPMMTAANIHYELADRVQGLAAGGIGAMLLLARRTGLIHDIDSTLHLLKRHLPYHESDHVLNIAFNILAGGRRIEHLELRRNDEVYLDALGAERIPDPTTAGDFCRRFSQADIVTLMDALNETRLRVWSQQPPAFFTEAILDVDGTLIATDAECKQGVDIAYDGTWGYHPLVISLANTAEPLYLVNRSGNRPSHEHAADSLDKMIDLCRRAGFQRVLLRGDTDFTQTKHLDRWDEAGDIGFVFGIDAHNTLKAKAEDLPAGAYSFLERPPRYAIKTTPRQKPERVKPRIVQERGFETIHLLEEMIAEFDYRPVACRKSYRVVVLRKRLGTDRGQMRLFEEYRYFFSITNDRTTPAEQIVFSANDRCDQENLIAQLKSGVHALTTPVDDLVSNWAYMVMAGVAWSLKAWSALMVPVSPRHAAKHKAERRLLLRMEFATFCAAVIQMPCQIVRGGGRLIYRLLSWNPWQGVFLRLVER